MATEIQPSFHIFECLKNLSNIMFSPVRDLSGCDSLLPADQLPFDPYCRFSPRTRWTCRLKIKKTKFDSFPDMPPALAGWVGDWGGPTPAQPPQAKKYRKQGGEFWQGGGADFPAPLPAREAGERFDADPGRVAAWEKWLRDKWRPWANDNVQKYKAILAYEKIRALQQKLARGEGQFELFWGAAVFYWKFGDVKLRRPLLTQRLEIECSPDTGEICLAAKHSPARLEYEALSGIPGVNFKELFSLENSLFDAPFDLFDAPAAAAFSQRLAAAIGNGCETGGADKTAQVSERNCPVICLDEQALFLRRLDGRQWRGELEAITEAVEAGAALPGIFGYYYGHRQRPGGLFGKEQEEAGNLLFPWRTDSVCADIARRLASDALVVVQTPPQSAKEAFVADMLAHLLAQGQKVLVTGPLREPLQKIAGLLRKDLPELAGLCALAVGNGQDNARELLAALKMHRQKLNGRGREKPGRAAAKLKERLDFFQRELDEDRRQVQAARALEHTRRFSVKGQDLAPWQTAKWLQENRSRLGFIPDDIGHDQACPLDKDEMNRFFALAGKMSLAEEEIFSLRLPPGGELLDSGALSSLFSALSDLKANREKQKQLLDDCAAMADVGAETIAGILAECQQALADLPDGGSWIGEILREIVELPHKNRLWQECCQNAFAGLERIKVSAAQTAGHAFTLPEEFPAPLLREALYDLRLEFYKNKRPGILFKALAKKSTVRAYKECLVDGLPADGLPAVDLLLGKINCLDEKEKAADKWNFMMAQVQGPRLDASSPSFPDDLAEYAAKLRAALDWRMKYFEKLKEHWQKFVLRQPPRWADRDWLIGLVAKLRAWLKEKKIEELEKLLARQHGLIMGDGDGQKLDPICRELSAALSARDVERWQFCLDALLALENKHKLWREFKLLYEKLREAAPVWAKETATRGREANLAAAPQDWPQAWRFKQAGAWLKRHMEGNPLEKITARFYNRRLDEPAMIGEFAAAGAWNWQIGRLAPEEVGALDFILGDAGRGGEETTDGRPDYEFWRAAEFWRMSLPAWVMPLDILTEAAGPFDRMFDVVIAIDSEKCDIFSAGLLLRGKKALIAGDNALAGPAPYERVDAAVNIALEKAFLGVPDKMQFALNDSLYDFALRLADNRSFILGASSGPYGLNEFIGKHFYAGKLPLPPPAQTRGLAPALLKIPARDARPDGQTNADEARIIIARLALMLTQKEYEGKTAAIITLGGAEQQQLLENFLLEQIPEQEIAARRLVASALEGYTGGRRDVILVSCVSARIAEAAGQRQLNGVLGLAREQVALFHPFSAQDLPAWSAVAGLLDLEEAAVEGGKSPDALFEQFSTSEIVRDIFAAISQRGYKALPEYEGRGLSCRFDIVIKSEEFNVAVVCDGIRNQEEIERLMKQEDELMGRGWHFYHIRGCAFYADKSAALSGLWKKLAALGMAAAN
ncbi:MAG: hypothetical protein LBO03_08000 [Acidaminococcales bacterium]|jgi:hypothetical protein|nr:hypothetical protein [Acidaminococcales bacterium]